MSHESEPSPASHDLRPGPLARRSRSPRLAPVGTRAVHPLRGRATPGRRPLPPPDRGRAGGGRPVRRCPGRRASTLNHGRATVGTSVGGPGTTPRHHGHPPVHQPGPGSPSGAGIAPVSCGSHFFTPTALERSSASTSAPPRTACGPTEPGCWSCASPAARRLSLGILGCRDVRTRPLPRPGPAP